MAAKRKTRAREARLGFEALSIEGGLLSPEWLSKMAQLQAGTQAEADYRIPKGLNLRDEIGRYWRIAQAHWADFKAGRDAKADPKVVSEHFIPALLRDAFGFASLVAVPPAVRSERTYPIGHAALGGRVPVVIAPADTGLDTLSPYFGDGSRKRSAFGLAQEYLNAQDGALWGIASDGTALRIMRDNASLTRPAWIEADLQRIFTEERYADFAALWLLCHETRFGREGQPLTECALEAWRNAGREEGTRAREHLRRGVEEALVALGQGFLSHADNQTLRAELQSGALPVKNYFNQLLRLVYRLIFLLTVEERGLLHPDGTSDAAKALYANGYGIRRLRDRSVKRSAHDRFSDLWDATRVVNRGLAAGETRLGLPALVGIFAGDQCPALDAAKLENRALLLAVFKLAWLREDGSLSRVNWRDMGPEELGSVYESLLELVPEIAKDGRQFAFATGGETKGNARKTTGSYYTPDSLVQMLLDSALEPVIADTVAQNPSRAVEALLGLSIVDPACGSGHFLLAAARRLAAHVARLQADGTPSATEYRHAIRQVIGRCIFGVDLNPMAVELCKVGLWMEAVEPGLPLTFLNSHIQHGNALLGTTPELMAKGIPDAAWDAIEADDKNTVSALKKRNKNAAEGQRSLETLWSKPADDEAQTVTRAITELDAVSDASAEALAKKEAQWGSILGSQEYRHQKFVADAWCAAFVWPKQPGALADVAPTNELWRQLRDRVGHPPAAMLETVNQLIEEYHFFHWRLQFPQVFAKGGFDLIIGNPPWDKIQPEEEAFFASRIPEIALASSSVLRKKLIAELTESNPVRYAEWMAYRRGIEGVSHLLKASGRFPASGQGNLNLYRCFVELAATMLRPGARAGLIVQTAIATGESGKELFASLLAGGQIRVFLDFENREGFFPDVDERFRFCLLTLGTPNLSSEPPSVRFGWLLRSPAELEFPDRLIRLAADEICWFNPKSKTSPVFRDQRELEIARRMYARSVHVSVSDADRFVSVKLLGELFNLTRDAKHFVSETEDESETLPLYEAKYLYQFDHRYSGAEKVTESARDPLATMKTSKRVARNEVMRRLQQRGISAKWLVGFRRIASATNERTAIMAVLPRSAVGNTINIAFNLDALHASFLASNVNSFPFDFACRQKVTGTDVNLWVFEQLPVIRPEEMVLPTRWARDTNLAHWLASRVLELTYTAWDLEPFARELGYQGSPFRWSGERRFLLARELDAAFFHLYGLSREDTEYVMDTFPIVRKNDEQIHGKYRTKRAILEIYDAMAEAVRTGKPFQTRLNPSPADSSVAHPALAPPLPTMPTVVPQLQPAEEAAIVIWALLHAAGGTLTRTDLARAFALRGRPDLLRRLAPASVTQAGAWATRVGTRSVAQGILATTLKTLADRDGVALSTNAESRSTVGTTPSTPEEERLDPWFRFEARLALQVLRALPASAFETVDNSFSGDDRALLERAL